MCVITEKEQRQPVAYRHVNKHVHLGVMFPSLQMMETDKK